MSETSRYCDVCNVEAMVKIDDEGKFACEDHFRECEWCYNERACDRYDEIILCESCYEESARWCIACEGARYYEDMELIDGDYMCNECLEINKSDGNVVYNEESGEYEYVKPKEVKG